MSVDTQQVLVTLAGFALGGGGFAAVLSYIKDRRIQRFSEEQIRHSEALESDDRRILANSQALEVVERWNSRLESKVDDLQSSLTQSEGTHSRLREENAGLREENAVLREKVAQLEERVSRLQNHADDLKSECVELRQELRKLANGGPPTGDVTSS